MKRTLKYILPLMTTLHDAGASLPQQHAPGTAHTTNEAIQDNKLVIYQLFVRLFGNKTANPRPNGSIAENGSGRFNDVNDRALEALKEMGVSHIWYTGVIAHASMTDYSAFGIEPDDPDIVKGRAGSPYAIRDYYDVDPDLAEKVPQRMQEFEALVARTHRHGLKVLIDFVPNHVARTYHSYAKPAGVKDFGEDDDTSKAFDPRNDFYYIPGKRFVVPAGGTPAYPGQDGQYAEVPARATGNNVFSERPSINDWSETIKLNYGVDYSNGNKTWFNPVPPVWQKMRDILLYWSGKGVDGFRCDVAEMVPVEFWSWVIPQVKKARPGIIFIAEAYNPKVYTQFIKEGHFDFLYDKVGLYDALKKLIRNEPSADVQDIVKVWSQESRGISSHMLRFLENHDEERIASAAFAGNPFYAVPGMVVCAALGSGPVMIYNGQESGEPGEGSEGFSGDDGRTTIFDYWSMPAHLQWMNNGAFDGKGLDANRQKLRTFYVNLLRAVRSSEALRRGRFYEHPQREGLNNRQYAWYRYTEGQLVLAAVNFDRQQALKATLQLPQQVQGNKQGACRIKDLLSGTEQTIADVGKGIPVEIPAMGAGIYEIVKQ